MSAAQLAAWLDQDDEELISEFTEQEFFNELNKYPKVRDSNSRVEVDVQPDEGTDFFSALTGPTKSKPQEEAKSSTDSIPPPSDSTIITSGKDEMQEDKDFWVQLKEFLSQYYNDEESEKIFKNFQQSHKNYLNELSLDDVERLAVKIKGLPL